MTRSLMLFVFSMCLLSSHVLHAQLLSPQASSIPEGRAVGLTDEIREIIEKMLANYREAETYEDQGRVSIHQKTGRVLQITKMPSSIIMRRPNQYQMVGGGQLISSDGKTLQIVLDGLGQYTSTEAPLQLTSQHVEIAAMGGGVDQGYAEIKEFLLGQDVYHRWIRRVKQIEMADKQQEVGGHDCYVVRYESIYKARVDLYIDTQRFVLLRSVMDLTRAQDPANAPPRPDGQEAPTITINYALDPVQINEPIAKDKFAVVPPDRARLVRQFKSGEVDQQPNSAAQAAPDPGELLDRFVGKPAPEVQAANVSGEVFSSEEMKNRVTLLFLWSPNGGLDCLRAIQMVQRVADSFKNEPKVSVLGVSGEGDNPDTILDLLRAKKATFNNLIDEDNLTMRAFQVQSLPLFFIVSGDGTVQHAWYGAPYEREQQIVSKLKEELVSLKADKEI